jgi:peroxiredoxin
MYRVFKFLGLAAALVMIAACSKPTTGPPAGPALKPPAETPGDAPAQGATIGTPAPAWANLEGTDGKSHNLNDLAEADAVAVVFTCNHCPFAQAYEERLVKFATDYKDKGVELVAINVSNLDADKLPAMKERAEEKGFNFAYIYDPSQNIAREFGATNTPHAFVLDKSRKIIYTGAIDDNENDASVTRHYVREAVDAALAGKSPELSKTDPVGCSIKYD